jgi:hypothetical protein
MQPRFFYHPNPEEPQHTFIAPRQLGTLTFGGWGPSL